MQRSEVPSLDDLRAFQTVARLGSVRAAAAELALTHGAVSRRVSKLATDLGLRLLEADGRGVRLTSDGAKLAEATGKAFHLITDPPLVWVSGSIPGCRGAPVDRWRRARLRA
ncbi:LysR family transcriptional regulator [Mesorhizobium sp.]|uniref:helix-turn-helix domain-containing protein n=1 Tax=Mesorhizobium sp. TaxID=1871066 RepID=UPI00257D48EC|nr:LysR family transcriptional regulator [Mesorhizobium sp.]